MEPGGEGREMKVKEDLYFFFILVCITPWKSRTSCWEGGGGMSGSV